MTNSRQRGKAWERYFVHHLNDIFPKIRRNAGMVVTNAISWYNSIMNVNDLTNKKFNRLTALKRVGHSGKGAVIWLFRCDCGKEKEIVGWKVKSGHTKSCGCLQSEWAVKHAIELARRNITHGMSYLRPYSIWHSMLQRCLNKKSHSYKNYGGRGIKVCNKWLKFKGFLEDMKVGYENGLSIDRINNDGNYNKENCRWVTVKQQNNNNRNCHFFTYKGITKNITQWADKLGLNVNTVRVRIHRGQNELEALELK